MYTDMYGRQRMKINLHLHTTDSDGHRTPEEAAAIYRAAGYDMVAITDHRQYHESGSIGGLRILGGGEYNTPGIDGARGVYHILALGCTQPPQPAMEQGPQAILDEIHRCGGLAVLAHPAWSLNTVDRVEQLTGVDATEIYNTVSDAHESSRPYSGGFVDAAACRGLLYPLLATDDAHYYDGSDETRSYILLDCPPDAPAAAVLQAIREKRFFATQGPELHLTVEGDEAVVHCSPAVRIAFFTNSAWGSGHGHRGEGLTEARCPLAAQDTFIRAEVTDAQGNMAWSNTIRLK